MADFSKIPDGYFERIDTSKTPLIPTYLQEKFFKGKNVLLIIANNSSSTFTMADTFQQKHSFIFNSETTEGTKHDINWDNIYF